MVETARTVLGPGAEISGVKVVDDLGAEPRVDPAIVLVSNNPYALEGPPSRGGRPTLGGGRLGIIVIDRPAPQRRPTSRAWDSASLRVDAPEPVHVGIDGEAAQLTAPLEFAIRPAALRVRGPPGPFRRRQRSSAATANGAKATPLTDPAIASSG